MDRFGEGQGGDGKENLVLTFICSKVQNNIQLEVKHEKTDYYDTFNC
ncbi:hypothetical protein JBW_03776 [Pelosinus fermentans JBW45]|uniref:Uncharacterized protein n=1 Tax=Pelosinus fermentans JBW45 TaxID=1192197 RepID=I9DKN1_9FIRM|nr:hypothetical protein JBW_03776 [Pelosinus fermentans JBW45]